LRRLRIVHRYLSLLMAGLWLVQVLSGVVLVFRWELDDAAVRGPAGPVQVTALADRLDALQRRFPLAPVQAYASGGVAGRFDVLVSPASGQIDDLRIDGRGEVLRWRPWNYDWGHVGVLTFTAWLHDTLFAGTAGAYIVGLSGLLLLSNLLLAVRVAWPLGGRWRPALLPRPLPNAAARLHAWHRAAGFWTAAAALVLAATGSLLAFDAPLRGWLRAEHPSPATPAKPHAGPFRTSTATAIRTAWSRYPNASLYSVGLATAGQPWVRVGLRQPGEATRFAGNTAVYVDADTGRIRLDDDALHDSARTRALDAVYALHTGEIASLPGRALALATGLALAALMTLGVALWAVRRGLRRPARRARSAAGLARDLRPSLPR
jgi:uncharacterized iron-regulated membrane protein